MAFVYFIAAHDFGQVKIGFSEHPKKRLLGLQTSCGCALTLLGAIKGTRDDERRWHEHFADLRVQGEWFRFSDALRSVVDVALHCGSLVGRVEKLMIEGVALGDDVKDTFAEAEKCGFDVALVRQIVFERKIAAVQP